MKTRTWLLISLLICTAGSAGADAVFGRLYTTPGQRVQLDEARSKSAHEPIIVTITEAQLPETDRAQPEANLAASITLDGIVYRTDGKNTAWINRSSTNEGNLETQFTKVEEKDVRSNEVRITLPDNQTRIDLKVGQQYDLNSKQINDLVKDPANPARTSGPP